MEEIQQSQEAPEIMLVERSKIEQEDDEKFIEFDKTICFDTLAPNSIVVLKVGGDYGHKMRMHQAFIRFAKGKEELFKERKLTVLFLNPEDDLSVLSQEDMNAAGWEKKKKSAIVKPY